jgi:flagellin-like protein
MKGISPLIASVILIAVTLAIAGILSTWAFQFVGRTQTGITIRTECIGALQFTVPPSYSAGNLTLSYINTKSTISLDNLTAIYTFANGQVNQTALGTLGPSPASGSIKIVGLPSKPVNLKLASTNCEGMFLADTAIV